MTYVCMCVCMSVCTQDVRARVCLRFAARVIVNNTINRRLYAEIALRCDECFLFRFFFFPPEK